MLIDSLLCVLANVVLYSLCSLAQFELQPEATEVIITSKTELLYWLATLFWNLRCATF